MADQSDEIQKAVEQYFEKNSEKTTPEREFCESTTLHGPGNFANVNKSWWLRLLWVLVFLGCMGVCLWQISLRVTAYLQYNANTKVSTQFRDKLEFPAVTICNFNRYQKSKAIAYVRNLDIPDNASEVEDLLDIFGSISYDDDLFGGDLPPGLTSFTDNIDDVRNFTLETGFQLDSDTLLACTWRGRNCTAQNFTHVFTQYGNCYTFNGRGPRGRGRAMARIATQPGEGSGLHLLINIHQDEYYESISGYPEAGIKVLAHNQSDIPLIESLGVSCPPGFHTFMGIRKYDYENLIPPWGVCSRDRQLKFQENYTLSGCIVECQLQHFERECKCRPLGYPGNLPPCHWDKISSCIKKTIKKYKAGEYGTCDCPIPCEFSSYESTISYAAYPNQEVANVSYRDVSEDYLRNNYVSLDIYYEELNYQHVKENEALTFSGLISDIGGQTGLFLGASFITFGEVIEYLARRIKKCLGCNGKKPDSNEAADKSIPLKQY